MKLSQTRVVPLRIALKVSLLAGLALIVPLYSFLAWAEFGYPARTAVEGISLLLLLVACGWILWRLLRSTRFGRGGSGAGPDGPQVREPRPPGGRPPALSAYARPDED
jgi:purine-cytosine permease-like protein